MHKGSVRLGLTGGIGSGKSTFATMLQSCGACLIDADAIAHSSTAPGGSAISAIRQVFGPDLIDSQGALNRERMRALAFSDNQARLRLQAIIHPLVHSAILQAEAAACTASHRLIVLDIPLLTESSFWPTHLDAILVVDCLEKTQIERVQRRSDLSPPTIRAIMAAQSSRAKRRALADIVVMNEEINLAELNVHAEQIAAAFGL